MLEPPQFETVVQFQSDLISRNGPVYYAMSGDQVVGWCDIFPESNPRHCHRGSLGMGILKDFRGKGIGSDLLVAILPHAKKFGLEKVELEVFSANEHAVALYRKFGFADEGLIRQYRKLDHQYFDCLKMAKFV